MLTVAQTKPDQPLALSGNPHLQPLDDEQRAEVLSFLSRRPTHTFIETSWIPDNGLTSSFNRGTFYGYRDATGELEGVALVGHITLFESQTDSAVASFAKQTEATDFFARHALGARCVFASLSVAGYHIIFACGESRRSHDQRFAERAYN